MGAAAENLRTNQRQLDMDGCEVGVSRQAVDETLAELDTLREAALALLTELETMATPSNGAMAKLNEALKWKE